VALCWAASICAVAASQTGQTPVFRSGVELVAIDVQVVDRDGRPTVSLVADQFDVSIDGRRRKVLSADLVRYTQSPAGRLRQTLTPALTPDGAPADRVFILAVDQLSFRPAAARVAAQAARQFLNRLQADDVVGVYFYPGSQRLDLTHERASVRGSLDRIVGLLDVPYSEFKLTISEVTDITAGDPDVLNRVVRRECMVPDNICAARIQGEAFSIGSMYEMQITQSFIGLRRLVRGLAHMPGRKTLVLLSGGLLASDRGGGRPDMKTQTVELGQEVAAANTNLYVLHLDNYFLDAFSAASNGPNMTTLFRDKTALGEGLDLLAGAAGGALFRVEAGMPDSAFERVLRETSAYYLLGVEVADADRDGQPHFIHVKVNQHGTTVRNRPLVVIPKNKS
jgi:VWFA-related protein